MTRQIYYSVRMRASKSRIHISGAEGIYDLQDVDSIVKEYTKRAFTHDKGTADDVRIIVERLSDKPKSISSLPVCTLNTRNTEASHKAAIKLLSSAGITERAVEESFKLLNTGLNMRGAMLMNVEGVRLEPDLLRGVRVTRMGITKKASADLSRKLAKHGLNNTTVKEALILASKVHRYRLVLGELCISDDPRYTTGYVASRSLGYIRLPHIKKRGIPFGGRAFFIAGGEVKDLIPYLQNIPVLVNTIRPVQGVVTLRALLAQRSRR